MICKSMTKSNSANGPRATTLLGTRKLTDYLAGLKENSSSLKISFVPFRVIVAKTIIGDRSGKKEKTEDFFLA
jgi:hypothetical protein